MSEPRGREGGDGAGGPGEGRVGASAVADARRAGGGARAGSLERARATPRARRAGWSGKGTLVRSLGAPWGRTRGDRRAHLAEELPRARLRLGEAAGEDRAPPRGRSGPGSWRAARAAPQRHRKWPGEESTRQQRRRQTGARVGKSRSRMSLSGADSRPSSIPPTVRFAHWAISLPAAHRSPSSPAMSNGWASSPPQVRDPLGARPPPPSLAPRADPPSPARTRANPSSRLSFPPGGTRAAADLRLPTPRRLPALAPYSLTPPPPHPPSRSTATANPPRAPPTSTSRATAPGAPPAHPGVPSERDAFLTRAR